MEIAGSELQTERLDHHGITAGVCRDLGIANKINARIGSKDPRRVIQPGIAAVAMIINGLGFTNRRLYLTPQFFASKALSLLFEQEVEASQLDDHALGKCLDEIAAYGPTKLFGEIAFDIATERGLLGATAHLDSTSFALSGEYAQEEEGAVKVTHGFSKDHRPDLKQVMLGMVCSGPANLPLWMEPQDGNSSDKTSFHETVQAVRAYQSQLMENQDFLWVADSAFYVTERLASYAHFQWISRVPETLLACRNLVRQEAMGPHWTAMGAGYFGLEKKLIHGRVTQRWLIVFSEQAYAREKKSFEKQLLHKEVAVQKACWHLNTKRFGCRQDAQQSIASLQKAHPFFVIQSSIEAIEQYASKGRPRSDSVKQCVGYAVHCDAKKNEEAIAQALQSKGRFVLATNQLDEEALSALSLLQHYKAQQSIEGGFRFLKDPWFMVDSFFVKKPSRIGALMAIMSLCLLVYNIAQHQLREALKQTEETLPDQKGKPTQVPTMRWVFQLMEGIECVKFFDTVGTCVRQVLSNINTLRRRIIKLIGGVTSQIYGIPPDFAGM